MSAPYWALSVVGWVAAGMVAVVLVLYRRGHRGGSWLLLGAVLGPFILPIAVSAPGGARSGWSGAWNRMTGQPAAALLELADAGGVDLIVVGRRGRGLSGPCWAVRRRG